MVLGAHGSPRQVSKQVARENACTRCPHFYFPRFPMDELDAAAVQGKITLLPGYDAELTSVTFSIQDEDHTIGNALRYMLMKEYVQ